MKNLLPYFLFASFAAQAQTLNLSLNLSMGGELFNAPSANEIKKSGFSVKKNEYDEDLFTLTKSVPSKKLPLKITLANFSLNVSKDGLIKMDCSFGDLDYTMGIEGRLPTSDGTFLKADKPYFLKFHGAESASGSANCEGELKVSILP